MVGDKGMHTPLANNQSIRTKTRNLLKAGFVCLPHFVFK